MGAAESILVVERNTSDYQNCEVLDTFSSPTYRSVIRLLKSLKPPSIEESDHDVSGNRVEESLFSTQEFQEEDFFVFTILLINQHAPKQCFQLYRSVNQAEAEKQFDELTKILVPYIDLYPSCHTTEQLTALIKLRSTYPNWEIRQITDYLKIPEAKHRNPSKEAFSRQESQHQQECLELIKREKPSFARDFFGSTPLQFLTERHPELVANLVSKMDSLTQTGKDFRDGFDNIAKYTESPIHVAIRLSQDSVLKYLLEKGANAFIPCGYAYPLHLAMKHDSKGCMRLLLEHDTECVNLKDKKYQANVLHWAKSSDQIDLLAKHTELKFDERNFENDTPLHIMVMRKRLSPCISLLCHGANVNAIGKNGATPLHYSILHYDLDIVRALLFLGASLSIKDHEGKTALDYADENDENYHDLCDLFDLFSYGHSENIISERRTESILKEKTGREALLSLDGGGIRGLVLTEVLIALESLTKQCIYNLFDWVSGTSTGSFLAMSVANGRSVRHCQRAYLRLGRSCLIGIRPYPTEQLDQFLIDEFGKDTKMDLYDYPNVIVPAVVADRRPAMLHLFRNYNAPYDEHYQLRDPRFPRPPLPADQTMWLAIRSSCSAPSYFRSTGRYLDGGLIANNPTLDALSEIHKHEMYFKTLSSHENETNTNTKGNEEYKRSVTNLQVVVSIGTGRPPIEPLRPIDIYRPSSVWDTAEIVDNLKGFVDLMVDQVSASDDHIVDRTRSWCEMANIEYHRFQPTMSSDIQLNETDDRLLMLLLFDVRKYIRKHMDKLKKLACLLLAQDEVEMIT